MGDKKTLLLLPQVPQVYKRIISVASMSQSKNLEGKANIGKNSNFSILLFIPLALLTSSNSVIVLWYLFISILELSLSNQNNLITIISIFFILLTQLLNQALRFIKICSNNRRENKRTCMIMKDRAFKKKNFEDVCIGDVVLLQENDEVPADMVLVASGNLKKTCFIDYSQVTSDFDLQKRESVKEIQSLIDSLDVNEAGIYLSTVEFEIRVNDPNSDFKDFNGKLKIKNSPKSVNLTTQNLLLKGGKIHESTWVFAVAVYTGKDTKIGILTKQKVFNRSLFEKKMDKISFIICCGVVGLSVAHFVLEAFFIGSSWHVNDFFALVLLYHSAVPFPLLFIFSFGRWVYAEKICGNVRNPDVLEALGRIEYVLIEKAQVLATAEKKVHACIIGDEVFMLDFEESGEDLEENSVLSRPFSNTLKEIQYKVEQNFNSFTKYFQCLAVCNTAYPQENGEFLVPLKDSLYSVAFASEVGVKLIYRDSKKLKICAQGDYKNFSIIFHKESLVNSKKTFMLVKSLEESAYILYAKGDLESMLDLVHSSKIHLIEDLQKANPGLQVTILGCKYLSKLEADEFLYAYSNAKKSPVNKEGRIQAVIEQYEGGIDCLGIIGTLEKVDENTKETVRSLNLAGVKLWVTSGDNESNTIGTALGANIISANSEILRLTNVKNIEEITNVLTENVNNKVFYESLFKPQPETGAVHEIGIATQRDEEHKEKTYDERKKESKKSLELLRRTSLHPLLSHITNMKPGSLEIKKEFNAEIVDFTLVVDGRSFEIAMETPETVKLLLVLLFTAKTVCFFGMLPNHKAELAGLLRRSFSFNPVFMIIDTNSAFEIYPKADIKVSKSNSDIKIHSFSDLKPLLLYHGTNIYHNSYKVICLCIYFNVSFTIVLVLYNYLYSFTGTWIVDTQEIAIYSLILQVIILLPVYICDKSISNNSELSAEIYSCSILEGGITIKKISEYLLLSVFSAGMFILLMYLTFTNLINAEGLTYGIDSFKVYILMSFTIILVVVTFTETSRHTAVTLSSHLLVVLITITYLAVAGNLEGHELYGVVKEFFSNCLLVISSFATALVVFAVFYVEKIIKIEFFPREFEKVMRTLSNHSVPIVQTRVSLFESDLSQAFRISDMIKENHDTSMVTINSFLLNFNSISKEKAFISENSDLYAKTFSWYMHMYAISHIILFTYASFTTEQAIYSKILLLVSSSILFFSSLLQFTRIYGEYRRIYMKLFFYSSQLMTILAICVLSQETYLSIYPLFLLLIISDTWILFILFTLCEIILDCYFKSLFLSNYSLQLYILNISTICLISTLIAYMLNYIKRKEYLLISSLSFQMNKTSNILNLLLPAFVIPRVKNGIYYISEDQGVVSVLFLNICDFEELFADLSPYDLAGFLDELFGKFDQLCEIVGVTKIETVGKTYLASAGLKDSEVELDSNISKVSHARRVIELGFGMLQIIQRTFIKGNKVHAKIGISSGRVQAGVVGFHKPQFSLVGDTVNTASRMASTLKEYDSIQITTETFALVTETQGISFVPHSAEVKGKGRMETYLVKVKSIEEELNKGVASADSKSFMYFASMAGLMNLASTPGLGPNDSGRQRRNSYADIECRETLMFKHKNSMFIEKNSIFSLSCNESEREKKFRIKNLTNSYKVFIFGLLIAVVFYSVQLLIEISHLVNAESSANTIFLWYTVFHCVLYSVLLAGMSRYFESLVFAWILEIAYMLPILFLMLTENYEPLDNPNVFALTVSLHSLLLTHCSTLLFKHISVCCTVVFIAWTCYISVSIPSTSQVLSMFFIVLCTITAYHKEIKMRVYSNLHSKANKELEKTKEILTQMVPVHAYNNLLAEDFVIDRFSQVTLVYADIVGFTAWSSERSPSEVVSMLNEMFRRFDMMCVKHNIYKVHTIGDCYVAMSFIGGSNRDPGQECLNIISFAKAMMKTIREVNEDYEMGISMRIGIHTGDVTGGIMGKTIVRYDIYGKDVFIANSMESNGISGKVAVSQVTKEIISRYRPSMFQFEEHKTIEILGTIITIYLLVDNE